MCAYCKNIIFTPFCALNCFKVFDFIVERAYLEGLFQVLVFRIKFSSHQSALYDITQHRTVQQNTAQHSTEQPYNGALLQSITAYSVITQLLWSIYERYAFYHIHHKIFKSDYNTQLCRGKFNKFCLLSGIHQIHIHTAYT